MHVGTYKNIHNIDKLTYRFHLSPVEIQEEEDEVNRVFSFVEFLDDISCAI